MLRSTWSIRMRQPAPWRFSRPTLLMGVARSRLRLAAVGRTASRHTAERVGLFYSLNVAGRDRRPHWPAAYVAAQPRLGSEGSLALLGAVSFCSGLALLIWPRSSERRSDPHRISAPAAASCQWMGGGGRRRIRSCSSGPAIRVARGSSGKQEGAKRRTSVVHPAPAPARTAAPALQTINGNHQAGTDFPTTFIAPPHSAPADCRASGGQNRRMVRTASAAAPPPARSKRARRRRDVDVVELA
jgi:hypothetical protein